MTFFADEYGNSMAIAVLFAVFFEAATAKNAAVSMA